MNPGNSDEAPPLYNRKAQKKMLRETLKYKDLDGNEVEDTFEFSLNSAELTKMEVSMHGGLMAYFEKIVKEDNRGAIIAAFDKILLASVGRRSENGKLFLKTDDIVNEFRYSGAYEVMFFKLLTDAEYSSQFVYQVLPADMAEKLRASKPIAVDLPSTPAPQMVMPTAPVSSDLTQADLLRAMESPEVKAFIAQQQQAKAQNSPLGL